MTCDYCRFDMTFVFHRYGMTSICIRVIQTSKVYLISDNKSNQWLSIYCKIEVIRILVTIVISNM